MRHRAGGRWPPSACTPAGASRTCATAYDAPRHPPHQSNNLHPPSPESTLSICYMLWTARLARHSYQRTAFRMPNTGWVASWTCLRTSPRLTSLRVTHRSSLSLSSFALPSRFLFSRFTAFHLPLYPAQRPSALTLRYQVKLYCQPGLHRFVASRGTRKHTRVANLSLHTIVPPRHYQCMYHCTTRTTHYEQLECMLVARSMNSFMDNCGS